MGENLFLGVKDIAVLCGVSIRTIYSWVDQERIPQPIKIGRRCLWHRVKFLRFLEGLNKES
jgi:predicted DNA-binding transcriptional regulator AlpA